MTGSVIDPRALFGVAPGDYTTERTRLAKQARAAGDKAGAASLQGLKRPATAMWGVLAAGADAKAVERVVEATKALAAVQATGGDGPAMAEAVGRRRAAVGSLVESAITELARWDVEARPRRQEIRDIVDQLARRPEVAAIWIDGTLRDLPEQSVGFDAFGGFEVKNVVETAVEVPDPGDELAARRATARNKAVASETVEQRRAEVQKLMEEEQAKRDAAARQQAERERVKQRAFIDNARRLANVAETELTDRVAQLADASARLRDAEVAVAAAAAAHATAEKRRRDALALLNTLTDEAPALDA